MQDVKRLLEKAQYAAQQAGKAIMQVYQSDELMIDKKKDESPLTIADRRAHRAIIDLLAETSLPVLSEEGVNITYSDRKDWEYFWMVDPLDGTKEFINKLGEFTVNIALVHRGKPIAGVIYVPYNDILYRGSAETGVCKIDKGVSIEIPPLTERTHFSDIRQKDHVAVVVSRSHLSPETKDFIYQFKNVTIMASGSSLKFMSLLEYKADIYPRLGKTMEWDTAAAHAILNACNRGVYHIDLKSELTYNKPDLANPFFIAF